nr:biotin--[acetyl-CoA-carboxylase] ligase [uncultured Cohaesibacter sp.]
MIKLPEPYRLIHFDTIDSTNQYALDAAKKGDDGGVWIWAGEQTAGRGRRGRHWSSEEGNLAATLLVINPAPVGHVGQLPLLTATAVHRAICDLLPLHMQAPLRIKWPNDLLWGDQKICGILLESCFLVDGRQAVAVGIGVNCRKHPEKTDGLAAADIAQTGYDVSPAKLLERLIWQMADRISIWQKGANFAAIRDDWLSAARGLGQHVVARLPNETVEGTFEMLDENGALIMRLADGQMRTIYAGDVFLPGMTAAMQK